MARRTENANRRKAQRYLERYHDAERDMQKAMERMESVREQVGASGIDYSKQRFYSGRVSDPTGELAVKIESVTQSYLDEVRRCRKIEAEIKRTINRLESRAQREVLVYRYIYAMGFYDIADNIKKANGEAYSYGNIYNIHLCALDSVAKIMKN